MHRNWDGINFCVKNQRTIVANESVEDLIRLVRGQRVILDADLARVYGVPTKQLNQAVKRNVDRFPDDFAFQLTNQEVAILRSQIVTSKERVGRRYVRYESVAKLCSSRGNEAQTNMKVRASSRRLLRSKR